MKNNKSAIVILLLGFMIISLMACQQKPLQVAKTENLVYYTCTVHNQIHKELPGDCPICGMKLVKVEVSKNNHADNEIRLTPLQLQLAQIKTDTVKEAEISNQKQWAATVTVDERNNQSFNSRLAGRVQQLFVRAQGETIHIGQPVYTIYSEDLQETEKEYLLAKQQQKHLPNAAIDYTKLMEAAQNKLKLWGLSQAQINNLTKTENASPLVTIYSIVSGNVSDIYIHEGDYVAEGTTILKTQELGNLWVQAQLYSNEANPFTPNDKVKVIISDLNNLEVEGKVDLINPELAEGTKINLVRVSISNLHGTIKPDMQAYVSTVSHEQRKLALPVASILLDGKGSMVWVKNPNGSFSPRMVTLGVTNNLYTEVLGGIAKGEVIVSGGVYLLNSEFIFKRGNPLANMKM